MAKAYSDEWYREVAEIKATREREGQERWANLIRSMFPETPAHSIMWSDLDEIIEILDRIGQVSNTNHVFRPRGGGFDLTGADHAGEDDCIELLSEGVATIIKPDTLTFYAIGSDPQWYYFRLETKRLKPSGVYPRLTDTCEELCELSPGDYVERSVWDYGYYGTDEYGDELRLPEEARPIIREFSGSFVIFGKYSPYNSDSSTYDGRHNQVTSEEFANYIRRHTGAV